MRVSSSEEMGPYSPHPRQPSSSSSYNAVKRPFTSPKSPCDFFWTNDFFGVGSRDSCWTNDFFGVGPCDSCWTDDFCCVGWRFIGVGIGSRRTSTASNQSHTPFPFVSSYLIAAINVANLPPVLFRYQPGFVELLDIFSSASVAYSCKRKLTHLICPGSTFWILKSTSVGRPCTVAQPTYI